MPSIMHGGLNYSGGGSFIEPNPTGIPTEELRTIQIGNIIYSLPNGGAIQGIAERNYNSLGESEKANDIITENVSVEVQ